MTWNHVALLFAPALYGAQINEVDATSIKDRRLFASFVPATNRIHNFGAGPATLPLSVIEEVSQALPNLMDSGMGVCEVSHRSQIFQDVVDSAMARVRRVLSVPEDYTVLFLQGGASLQFYMTALNLLRTGEKADYLVTGGWSKKALAEAKRVGDAEDQWNGDQCGFKRVPTNDE